MVSHHRTAHVGLIDLIEDLQRLVMEDLPRTGARRVVVAQHNVASEHHQPGHVSSAVTPEVPQLKAPRNGKVMTPAYHLRWASDRVHILQLGPYRAFRQWGTSIRC